MRRFPRITANGGAIGLSAYAVQSLSRMFRSGFAYTAEQCSSSRARPEVDQAPTSVVRRRLCELADVSADGQAHLERSRTESEPIAVIDIDAQKSPPRTRG